MLAENEQEMITFLSQSPLTKLLEEDMPAVAVAKRNLEALKRYIKLSIFNGKTS